MASKKDNDDGAEGFKPSSPTNTTNARRGKKRQIDFLVFPLLKKAHPATPDQAILQSFSALSIARTFKEEAFASALACISCTMLKLGMQ